MRLGWICRIIYSISLIFGRLPIIGLWAEQIGPSFWVGTKGLNADVKRAKCFNGHASPLGFSEWACVFRWARLFLGPGEWVYEPYFSNPINYKITKLLFDTRKKFIYFFLKIYLKIFR